MTESEFRTAFAGHKDVVFRFAFRMTGSEPEAEDIAKDVFLALWRRPAGYQAARGELRAYLLSVARNLVLKKWRTLRPSQDLDPESLVCDCRVRSVESCFGGVGPVFVVGAAGTRELRRREGMLGPDYWYVPGRPEPREWNTSRSGHDKKEMPW